MELVSTMKKSSYRQSGWREVATGVIHEFYGSDQPPQDGTFIKVWDHDIVQETTVTPHVEIQI